MVVRFECSRCGRCCMNLGSLIRIERELDDRHFYCRLDLNHQFFYATIPVEQESRFRETVAEPGWCPFLRRDGPQYVCTIYETRPSFCREFRCSRLDILDQNGRRLGRVGGRRSLLTTDPRLRQIWEERILPLEVQDDREWCMCVMSILKESGFGVRVYE